MENRRRSRNFRAAVFVVLSIAAWGASSASASTTIDARGTYVGTAQADSGTYSSSTVIDQENCAAGTFSGGGVGYSTFSGTINGSTITTHEKYLSGSYTSDSTDTFSTDAKGRLVASGTFTDSNGHHGSNSGTRISKPKGDICGETVSVSLTPDKVNVCGNTCAPTNAVNVTVSVTGADGSKLSGENVALRADDPGVAVSPVTDAGAGTYTATLHPSHTPGNVIVTATDNSATPAASGSATLTQECNPDAGAAGDVRSSPDVFAAAGTEPCTRPVKLTMICEYRPSQFIGFGRITTQSCFVTVSDLGKLPHQTPTGTVRFKAVDIGRIIGIIQPNPCQLTPSISIGVAECSVTLDPGINSKIGDTLGVFADFSDPTNTFKAAETKYLSKYTPKLDESNKSDAADAETHMMAIAAVSGALAYKAPVTAPVTGATALIAGLLVVPFHIMQKPKEPPDRAYAHVFRPRIGRAPAAVTRSPKLSTAIRAFTQAELAVAGYAGADWNALNRSVIAQEKNDRVAFVTQMKAASKDELKLARLLSGLPALLAKVERLYPSSTRHLTLRVTAAQLAQLRRKVGTPSSAEKRLAKKVGLPAKLLAPGSSGRHLTAVALNGNVFAKVTAAVRSEARLASFLRRVAAAHAAIALQYS